MRPFDVSGLSPRAKRREEEKKKKKEKNRRTNDPFFKREKINGKTVYSCGHKNCNYSTNIRGKLIRHINSQHKPNVGVVCNQGKCKNAKFKNQDSYETHCRTKHSTMLFTCDECGKSFRIRSYLKEHMVTHSNLQPFVCLNCNESFKYKKNLLRHVENKVCLYFVPNELDDLSQAMSQTTIGSCSQSSACPIPSKRSRRNVIESDSEDDNIEQPAVEEIHPTPATPPPTTSTQTHDLEAAQVAKESYDSIPVAQLSTDLEQVTTPIAPIAPVRNRLGMRPDVISSTVTSLQQSAGPNDSTPQDPISVIKRVNSVDISKPQLDQSFADIVGHPLIEPSQETSVPDIKEQTPLLITYTDGTFGCPLPYCTKKPGFRFALKKIVDKHQKMTNHEIFKCEMKNCEEKFETMKEKSQHMTKKIAEGGHGYFACEVEDCLYFGRTERNLRDHKSRVHGAKKYHCPEPGCDMSFTLASTLERHILTHTKEKKFPCSICSMSFTQKYNRDLHQKLHIKPKGSSHCQCENCKLWVRKTRKFIHDCMFCDFKVSETAKKFSSMVQISTEHGIKIQSFVHLEGFELLQEQSKIDSFFELIAEASPTQKYADKEFKIAFGYEFSHFVNVADLKENRHLLDKPYKFLKTALIPAMTHNKKVGCSSASPTERIRSRQPIIEIPTLSGSRIDEVFYRAVPVDNFFLAGSLEYVFDRRARRDGIDENFETHDKNERLEMALVRPIIPSDEQPDKLKISHLYALSSPCK